MDERTAKALEASIKHWENNAAANTPREASVGAESCALCALFLRTSPPCFSCPVRMATGRIRCFGSPFDEADRTHDLWRYHGTKEKGEAFRAAAQAEVEFLKSLRDTTDD